MISLKHISTLSTFNQTKFSADSTDSSYFLGSDQTQIFQGTPDVKYNDLCYIKCSNLQYTHGHLYGSTEVGEAHVSLTQEEYDALSEEEKNNGKIYLIKESTIPDLIDQLPLATTSAKGLMSANDKKLLTRFNVYYSYQSVGTPGFTETFCKKFMEYVRNTIGSGLVIGRLRPDVTGIVIGYDYADGNYAGYQFFATNGHLHYFGYTNGVFFMKHISNS